MDCKKTSRSQVIVSVKGLLGDTEGDKPAKDIGRMIERSLHRLLALAQEAIPTSTPQEELNRIRTILADGARELQKVVADGSRSAPRPADRPLPLS